MPLSTQPANGWLQVGNCRVELASREVSGPDSSRLRRITPKSLAVLRYLAAAQGQVLSRDQLLAHVWANSAPTDDVLTQAITLLRKTFAALDASQPYIETIARSGYRLLVHVEVVTAGDSDSVITDPMEAGDRTEGLLSQRDDAVFFEHAVDARTSRHLRRRIRRRRLLAVMLALLFAGISLLAALLWHQHSNQMPEVAVKSVLAEVDRPYRLISASMDPESEPALSPDGKKIAYVRPVEGGGREVVTQLLAPNSGVLSLDVPPSGARDGQPVWSPDGTKIAFSRLLRDGRCAVLLAAVGGTQSPVSLMRCDRTELLSFDFTPDGQALIFGGSKDVPGDGGIARFDIAERRWTVLDYPRQEGDLDYRPRLSPDGRWIVFIRNPQLGQLWRLPAGGGAPTPLGDSLETIDGFAWLPDSRHVLVSRWVGMESRLFLMDALSETGDWGVDLGVDQAIMPAVARHAPVLSFVQRVPESRLAILRSSGAMTLLPGGRGQDVLPSVSPDAQRLLFVSDRSGVPAVWLGDVSAQKPPVMIPGLLPDTQYPASWAPDGSRALLVGLDDDGKRRIYEIDPETLGAVAMVLPEGTPVQVSYTDDPAVLLVVQQQAGRSRLVRYDRTHTPWRVLDTWNDVTQVRWDSLSGRALVTLFARRGVFDLSVVDDDTSAPVLLPPAARQNFRNWSVDARGRVWVALRTADCQLGLLSLTTASTAATSAESLRCLNQRGLEAVSTGFTGAAAAGPVVSVRPDEGGAIAVMALPGTGYGQLSSGVKSLIGK